MTRFATLLAALSAGVAVAIVGGLPAAAKDRITIDLVNEPSSLDPHMQWNPDSYYVYRNIFDNIVTRDDDGAIVPQLATSWKQLSDTELELTLRDDVTFHDGAPLTAEDVVYSVERITDKAFGSPQLGQFNKIVGAEATGPNTVVLTTDGPYPVLLAQLVKLSVVPKHAAEAAGKEGFNLAPVGSGPYAFESWDRGVQVTLTRNDAYWGAKGPFETVVFRAVPDASTRVADLKAGAADLVVGLDSDLAAQLQGVPGVKTLSALTERVGYLGLNTRKPPFDDLRVRRAVAFAIDKAGIAEGILGGGERPVGVLLSPAHVGWGEDVPPYPYEPETAKTLLAEAGETAKTPVVFHTAPPYDQRIVQAVQQMLSEAGMNVEIQMTDMATFLKTAQGPEENRPMLSFGRWSCACQDADGIMYPLLHASSNWSRYDNPEMDALLETGRNTIDPAERVAAYEKASAIVKDQVPVVPLYQAAALYGAAAPLQWRPTANESLFLNRMGWSE